MVSSNFGQFIDGLMPYTFIKNGEKSVASHSYCKSVMLFKGNSVGSLCTELFSDKHLDIPN